MSEFLKDLCALFGTSGSETAVRDYIISKIDGFCEYKTDPLGNILVNKTGKKQAKNKFMFDAHLDEVGIIVTDFTENGFLRFSTVGGIDTSVLLARKVKIGETVGVIGFAPVHLQKEDARGKLPDCDSLYIDIGAASLSEAAATVTPGDTGVILGDYTENGDLIISKALDDRVGCAVLLDLIRSDTDYGFCASFSVAEEIGCRGAKVAAYTLNPDIAFVLEGTTAADIPKVSADKTVCTVGGGVAVSFMDGGTKYDRDLYAAALNSTLPVQTKRGTTGGNDSAAIHLSRGGVKTLALSVPCRYIHSNSSVCSKADIKAQKDLCLYLLGEFANKEL